MRTERKNPRRRVLWLILLLAVGLLLPATPALADDGPPEDNGVIIWNEDYTLEEGEWVDGDLIVFNGDATLEEGSRVEGSVIVWNGGAEIAGVVEGDLVVSSGDITLENGARVEGDVVCTWNCDLSQDAGARVDGGIVEGIPLGDLRLENWRGLPGGLRIPSPLALWASGPGRVLQWTIKILRGVIAIAVVAAVAGLVALIWPELTSEVGRVVVEAPWHSFGIGLLTAFAGTVLIIALTITICLSPIAGLVGLALGAAGLFGWAAVGALVGERLLKALKAREIAPVWAAGLGTLVITLIGVGLSTAFCLAPFGWLMIFALGCLGLGAVVLTRFGTTPYTPPTGAAPHSPPTGEVPHPAPPPPSPTAPTPVEAADESEEPTSAEPPAEEQMEEQESTQAGNSERTEDIATE